MYELVLISISINSPLEDGYHRNAIQPALRIVCFTYAVVMPPSPPYTRSHSSHTNSFKSLLNDSIPVLSARFAPGKHLSGSGYLFVSRNHLGRYVKA